MPGHPLASLQDKFTKSAIAVFAVNGLGMVLLFVSQVVLARILGVDEYGVYAYILSCLGILALIGKFGLDSTLQRFIPEYAGRQEWGLCRGVMLRSYQIAILTSLLLAVVIYLLSPLILSTLQSPPGVLQVMMIAILPLWVLLKVTQGALLAFKHPVLSHLTENVTSPALMIIGALIVSFYAGSGAVTMLGLFMLACGVSLVLGLFLLVRRGLPHQVVKAQAAYKTGCWLRVALPLFVMSSMYVIMSYTDIVMLGQLDSTSSSGIYAAASRIAALVALPLMFLNTILAPYISELFHGDRHDELQHVVTLASRAAGLLALPVFVVLGLFGGIFLELFGAEFSSGKSAMNILLAGKLVTVLSGSVGMLMAMTGRHFLASIVITMCAALNVILNYILIPKMGINGAAIATAVTIVIWNLLFVLFTRVSLKIKPTFFAALKRG